MNDLQTPVRHAGLVAYRRNGRWAGALIEGPSGIGKSDLALRTLDLDFRLVADDRTLVWASGGRVFGRAPAALAGMVEVRGVGVLFADALPFCEVNMVVRCVGPEGVERLPAMESVALCGVVLPSLALWPLEPSAPAKLRRALDHLGAGRQPAYQAASRGAPSLRTGASS